MHFHKKQDHSHNILESEHVGRLLMQLAAPAFLGMFVQSFYNVINTVFMGQYVDALAIAALSIVFPIQMITWGVSQMMGMGGSSLISRFIGSRDMESAERTAGNGVAASIVLGIIITIIILPFAEFWLRLIGTSDAVMVYAKPYLQIIIACTTVNIFAMALLSYTRAEGNTRVGMIAMTGGAILSIILDAIFVIPMHMGVVGAALATIIAQIFSMVYIFSYYLSGSSYLKLRWANLRPDFKILKPMFSIGVSAFVQTAAGSLSTILLLNMVMNYGGDTELEAFGIVQRVTMFASMPAIVFGQALQPIIGYNFGAKRFTVLLKAIKQTAIYSTVISFVLFVLLYLFPGPIIRIFTSDPGLNEAGIHAARLIILSMTLMGVVNVGQVLFQSIGKAIFSFITAFVRPVLLLIPLVLIMSRLWGLDGVFLSFPSADFLSALLIVGLTLPIINRFRRLAQAEKQAENTRLAAPELVTTTHARG